MMLILKPDRIVLIISDHRSEALTEEQFRKLDALWMMVDLGHCFEDVREVKPSDTPFVPWIQKVYRQWDLEQAEWDVYDLPPDEWIAEHVLGCSLNDLRKQEFDALLHDPNFHNGMQGARRQDKEEVAKQLSGYTEELLP